MQAYKYDSNKRYSGAVNCQIDPLESKAQGHDIWLLPSNSTFVKPLENKDGYYIVWDGTEWVYETIPEPPTPEPTQEEKEFQVRSVRAGYLQATDYTQLQDAPFSDNERALYREYRQYLRDYTKEDDWWENNPPTYEEWLIAHHPVE